MIADFRNALKDGRVPPLNGVALRAVNDANDQPVVIEGIEALVAHVVDASGRHSALRAVPLEAVPSDWERHYAALGVAAQRELHGIVPGSILALEEPMVVGWGTQLRATVMDWVPGPTLRAAMLRAARAENVTVLRAIVDSFERLKSRVRASGVRHGDLVADNIMMRRDGNLVLVDLDTMSWPGATPRSRAGRVPSRYARIGGDPDAQEALGWMTLAVSLRAVAEMPDIASSITSSELSDGDGLLFTQEDLIDPYGSRVFAQLMNEAPESLREDVKQLRNAGMHRGAAALDWWRAGDTETTQHPSSDFDRAKASSAAASGDDWSLASAIERAKARAGDAEAPAQPTRQTRGPAQDDSDASNVERRRQLQAALRAGNDGLVAGLWQGLENDPVARTMYLEVHEAIGKGLARRIQEADRAGRDDLVRALGAEASERHIPLEQKERRILRNATERAQVNEDLQQALQDNDTAAMANLATSGRLVVLGDTDRPTLRRVLRALEWPALKRAIDADDDLLILDTYDPDLFGDAADLPEGVQERLALAETRRIWLYRVRQALRERRIRDVLRLRADEPEDGMSRLTEVERGRISTIIEQQSALDGLRRALDHGDDQEVTRALATVERTGARLEDRFSWSAIHAMVERVSALEDLIAAARTEPPDVGRLAQLVPAVRALGLEHDPRLHGDLRLDQLERRVARAAHARRIQRAIAKDDDIEIVVASVPDPLGARSELNQSERDRVALAIRRRRHTDRGTVVQRYQREPG